jgi:hypothetical protein
MEIILHRLMERLPITPDRSRQHLNGGRNSSHPLGSTIVLCVLAVALGGCHTFGNSDGNRVPGVRIQFSPNAEPLSGGPLGQPKCEEALSGWFDRTDRNRDGVIDREEFLADARLQFERMDQRHAGYVTAADLSVFRAPYEPVPGSEHNVDSRAQDDTSGPRGSSDGSSGKGNGADSRRRGPSIDTRADPVMSADKTLSFKVTQDDFIAQARDIFESLDHNHDGRVTREAVLGTCPKPK